jgi:hypothetical protein
MRETLGIGFRVQSSEFRVQSSKFRVQSFQFKVSGSEFKVQSIGRWEDNCLLPAAAGFPVPGFKVSYNNVV